MKVFLLSALVCLCATSIVQAGQFAFELLDDRVRISTEGNVFTEYRFKERRPCFFPVLDLDGRSMTREWPLNDDSGIPESTDHPHHTGVWFAHGMVWRKGDEKPADFWHNESMEHRGFQDFEKNAAADKFIARNRWKQADGSDLCRSRTTVQFGKDEQGIWMDYEMRIVALPGKDLHLGDTKEGVFGLRVPETMAMEAHAKELRHISKGNIITSEGVVGKEAWGKRAKWCAYTGDVDNKPAVIAIFDHPSNPRHPTWWMARHYGLFAANAFGISYYEEKPEGTGNFVVEADSSVTFKWRLLFLNSEFDKGDLNKRFKAFALK